MAAHTLTDGTTSVQLPADMVWQDEYEWTPISQGPKDYTLSGAMILQEGEMLAGRPITLSGAEDRAWVQKSVVDQLYALASVLNKQMTLTLADSRSFTVMWRHADTAIAATPVIIGTNKYYLTLRLMQV